MSAMTFALVFLFSEETGDLFSMKVIAISTTLVGVVFIVLSLIIRAIVYKTTKQSLEEVEPNNYLDHTEEDDFEGVNNRSKEADSENVEKPKDESHSAVDSEQAY